MPSLAADGAAWPASAIATAGVIVLALLVEGLLLYAFRRGKGRLLRRLVSLVMGGFLVATVLLLSKLPFFLWQLGLYGYWPWSWALQVVVMLVAVGVLWPSGFLATTLLFNKPQAPRAKPAISRKFWFVGLGCGILFGILWGILGGFSPRLRVEGAPPLVIGWFSLDGLFVGFLWGLFVGIAPHVVLLQWWASTFTERRWMIVGTVLLLFSAAYLMPSI